MKVLSLTQPWATLVAIGAKTIETRSWATPYRGPLAIHASKGFPKEAQHLCRLEPFCSALAARDFGMMSYNGGQLIHNLPVGCIIATCRLVNCIRTEEIVAQLSPQEVEFGDYDHGRWAWVLTDIQRLNPEIPAKGSLGLWTHPDGLIMAATMLPLLAKGGE